MSPLHPNPATPAPPMGDVLIRPWCLGGSGVQCPLVLVHSAPVCPVPSPGVGPQAGPVGPCPSIQCHGDAGPSAGASASAWEVPMAGASAQVIQALVPVPTTQPVALVPGQPRSPIPVPHPYGASPGSCWWTRFPDDPRSRCLGNADPKSQFPVALPVHQTGPQSQAQLLGQCQLALLPFPAARWYQVPFPSDNPSSQR